MVEILTGFLFGVVIGYCLLQVIYYHLEWVPPESWEIIATNVEISELDRLLEEQYQALCDLVLEINKQLLESDRKE